MAELVGGPMHGQVVVDTSGTHMRGRPVMVDAGGVRGYLMPFYVWYPVEPGVIAGVYVGTYPHHTSLEQVRALFRDSGRMMGER